MQDDLKGVSRKLSHLATFWPYEIRYATARCVTHCLRIRKRGLRRAWRLFASPASTQFLRLPNARTRWPVTNYQIIYQLAMLRVTLKCSTFWYDSVCFVRVFDIFFSWSKRLVSTRSIDSSLRYPTSRTARVRDFFRSHFARLMRCFSCDSLESFCSRVQFFARKFPRGISHPESRVRCPNPKCFAQERVNIVRFRRSRAGPHAHFLEYCICGRFFVGRKSGFITSSYHQLVALLFVYRMYFFFLIDAAGLRVHSRPQDL